MLVPMKWLKNYLKENDLPVEEYVRRMIMAGNAVEGVNDLGAEIEKVVVGKIVSIVKHPDADKLSICQVEVGQDAPIQIVTGANNMKEGDYVPVALDGSHLPGGVKIKKGKLRGEVSLGMMCSNEELGVPNEVYPSNTDHGLLILQGTDYTPGQDIKPILGLDETVLDFEILANRPDCLSMLGIAYESAAAAGGKCVEPQITLKPQMGDVNDYARVDVEDEELCPRYCARVVKNIKIEPSPLWMRQYLHAAGVKPINNIVDITNFVMLEMGQPMHAFDLDSVKGRHIIVRRAAQGEVIRTLDGKDRELTHNMLVIADESGATGLAGVMGGEGSEITESTKLVLFESACFQRASIRQTGRALGLRTEAQGRFERGVNVQLVRKALERAVQLVEQLGAGEVVSGVIDVYPTPVENPEVRAKIGYVQTLMGIKVPAEEMKTILEGLSIQTRIEGDELVCRAPAYRQDILCGADVAEEVLRIYGYDKIPETLPQGANKGGRISHTIERNREIRKLLCGMGMYELVTFSTTSPKNFDKLLLPEDSPLRKAARLLNPIGEDYSVMRTTLIPSVLDVLATNKNHALAQMAAFEIGVRFLPKAIPLTELPEERPSLCIGAYGGNADFYAMKGAAEAVCERFGIRADELEWKRSGAPYLHPGRAAEATLDGRELIVLGQIDAIAAKNFGLDGEIYIAEIDLSLLDEKTRSIGDVKAAPRYPAVSRDFAFVVTEETPVGDLMRDMQQAAGALFEQIDLFDIYRGVPIQPGYKSVALKMSIRALDHTLTEQEITRVFGKAVDAAAQKHNAVLRS